MNKIRMYVSTLITYMMYILTIDGYMDGRRRRERKLSSQYNAK